MKQKKPNILEFGQHRPIDSSVKVDKRPQKFFLLKEIHKVYTYFPFLCTRMLGDMFMRYKLFSI